MYVGSLPPASNRARYVLAFQISDDDTGEAIDLTDIGVTLSLREPGTTSAILTATDGSGIDVTNAADGIFELTFTATQMRTLDPLQYEVGCTLASDDDAEEVDQYIIGTLAVLDGVVN